MQINMSELKRITICLPRDLVEDAKEIANASPGVCYQTLLRDLLVRAFHTYARHECRNSITTPIDQYRNYG